MPSRRRLATTLLLVPLRLKKVLWMLRHRRWRRLLRHGVAPSIEHAAMLRGRRYVTVLDVGANVGQFAMWSDETLCPARILCFEPLPSAQPLLERVRSTARADTSVLRVALGAETTTARLNITSASDNSSLLDPGVAGRDMTVVERIGVDVARADDVLAGLGALARPVLLKIDVQGTELDVLRGFGEALAHVDSVLVELSFAPVYDGQSAVSDVLTHLASHGFEPVSASRVPGNGVGLLAQIDVLLERPG